MKRIWEIGAAGAALVLVFAGCSNNSSSASSAAASSAASAAQGAASGAASAAQGAASAAQGAASAAQGAASAAQGAASGAASAAQGAASAAKGAAAGAAGAAAGAAGAMKSAAGNTVAAAGASASDGGKVYTTNCSSCHQAQGQGIPGTFPPLAGNAVVTGDATKLIHIVKYGLQGSVTVAGHAYNGQMPAWGKGTLSDADIAAVVTYIRSSWGNSAGAVSTAQVTAVAQ
jgi:mono/diheme cytochrome c family protein